MAVGVMAVGRAEVVVTATRTVRGPEAVPAAVTVLGTNDLAMAAPITVDEMFKRIGGVDLQGSGFPGAPIKLNMRGLTPGYQSKRILVLADGRRINEQYQGNVDFTLLSADGLERIEVLRGPASALYGSGAMGGVIQLFSRTGRDMAEAGETARVRLAGGSHDTWHGRLSVGGVFGPLDAFVSASVVETGGYLENRDGSPRDWKARGVSGNLGWPIGETADVRLFTGAYSGEGRDDNSAREVDKDYQHLRGRWEWDSRRQARLRLDLWRNGEATLHDWVYPGQGLYDQNTLAAEIEQSLWVASRHYTTGGVELRRDAVAIDEVAGRIDESTTVSGVYVQDEYHLSEAWRVLAGIRYDNTGSYGETWSPRTGLLWKPCDAFEGFGSVNVAHRAPGLSDRFVKTVFGGAVFEGNPELEPETLMAYELGMRWRLPPALRIELVGFVNAMDDSFDFTRDPDGVFRIRNVTRSRTVGLESSLGVTLSRNLEAFAAWSYTDGTYRESEADRAIEGRRLAYLAPHKVTVGLDASWQRFRQSLVCRYVDERFADARNTEANRLDEYITVDWRGRWRVTDRLELTLNIDNLFDADYRDFPDYPQPGITVMAGIEGVL